MTTSTPTPTDDPVPGSWGSRSCSATPGWRSPPTGPPRSSPRSTRSTSRAGCRRTGQGASRSARTPTTCRATTPPSRTGSPRRRAAAPRSPTAGSRHRSWPRSPRPRKEGDGERGRAAGAGIRARASGTEVLRNRDFGDLTPAEREHLRRLIALLDRSCRARLTPAATVPARCHRRPPHPARHRCATRASRASCTATTARAGRARWCCSSTSRAPWSPTPTRCCVSPTSWCAARPARSRPSPSAPG